MKTVASFMAAPDAHMLRIRLEDVGIPATICDEATTSLAPHYINAIGGIRVQVSEEDFAAARIVAQQDEPEVELREGILCPACGSADIAQALDVKRSYLMSFFVLFLLMLPMAFVKRRYRCNHCNHLWK